MKKLNVLYVDESRGFGGSVNSLYSILKRIDNNNFNPVVLITHIDHRTQIKLEKIQVETCYIKGYCINNPKGYRISNSVGYSVQFLFYINLIIKAIFLIPKTAYKLIRSFLIVIYLYPWLKNKNIALVHLNNKLTVNLVGLMIAKVLRVPCICHVRGNESKFRSITVLANFVDFFIPVSNWLYRELTALGISKKKQKVIYNSIDVNECILKSEKYDISYMLFRNNRRKIGLVGMIQRWKGQKVFILSANRVLKVFPNCNFYIIGDVPAKAEVPYKKEIIELIEKLGLSEQFVFTGYQDNIFPFIKAMDIIVHSSILPEPFGRVIIEAMALEKPIIASRAGGPEEIIENGKNGFLIEPGDYNKLCETIIKLLKNPKLALKIGQLGRKKIEKQFSGDYDIRQIEDLYRTVLFK